MAEVTDGIVVGTYVEHLGHGADAWWRRIERVAAVAREVRSSCRTKPVSLVGDFNTRSVDQVHRLLQ